MPPSGVSPLAALATAVKLDLSTLQATSKRLAEDSQVRLIWLLYQLDEQGENEPQVTTGEETPSPNAPPAA